METNIKVSELKGIQKGLEKRWTNGTTCKFTGKGAKCGYGIKRLTDGTMHEGGYADGYPSGLRHQAMGRFHSEENWEDVLFTRVTV